MRGVAPHPGAARGFLGVVALAALLASTACDGPAARAWRSDPRAGRGSGLAAAPGPTTLPAARAGSSFGHGVAPPGAAAGADLTGGLSAVRRIVPVASSERPPLAIVEGDGAIALIEIDADAASAARWQRPCAGGVVAADAAGVVCGGP